MIGAALAALAPAAAPADGVVRSDAKTLCVGGRGCFPTIQLAIDAAHDGDTVTIGPGTFAGGVTIAKSITVVGAGAGRTIVKGYGPVVSIGDSQEVKRVVVTVRGITVTGGLGVGQPGGVLIGEVDPTKAETVVTIVDCVITRNRAVPNPKLARAEGNPTAANGGGIVNVGQLTLLRTTVSNNVVGGGTTVEARGGGIWNATGSGPGSLTIRDSRIVRNTAIVTARRSQRAEGGGIEAQDGPTLTITGSVISGNRAILDTHAPPGSADPSGPGVYAAAGGIQIGGGGKATIAGTRITGNVASAIDPEGNPIAFASAILVSGPRERLVIRDTTITGNRTEADILQEDAPGNNVNCCTGDVVEIDGAGSVTRTTIARNTNIARVQRGTAVLVGTVAAFGRDRAPLVIADSVIEGNAGLLVNANGIAWADGGGLWDIGGWVVLRSTRVSGNTLTATGKTGHARGGGLYNGVFGDANGRLTLGAGTLVTGNVLHGSPGIKLEGGGVYAATSVKITGARIVGNKPNECRGCQK